MFDYRQTNVHTYGCGETESLNVSDFFCNEWDENDREQFTHDVVKK